MFIWSLGPFDARRPLLRGKGTGRFTSDEFEHWHACYVCTRAARSRMEWKGLKRTTGVLAERDFALAVRRNSWQNYQRWEIDSKLMLSTESCFLKASGLFSLFRQMFVSNWVLSVMWWNWQYRVVRVCSESDRLKSALKLTGLFRIFPRQF